jgi:hypothetical protein
MYAYVLFFCQIRSDIVMIESEVEELCQKIVEEYEAMKRGPTGFALGISKHAFIDARLKRVDSYHSQLAKYIGDQEATIIICKLYIQVMG